MIRARAKPAGQWRCRQRASPGHPGGPLGLKGPGGVTGCSTGGSAEAGCPPLCHSALRIEGDRHHGQGVAAVAYAVRTTRQRRATRLPGPRNLSTTPPAGVSFTASRVGQFRCRLTPPAPWRADASATDHSVNDASRASDAGSVRVPALDVARPDVVRTEGREGVPVDVLGHPPGQPPGTSAGSTSPIRRQPFDSSHVRGAATSGGRSASA